MRPLEGRGLLADTHSPRVAWIDAYLLPEDQQEIWPLSLMRSTPSRHSRWNIAYAGLTGRSAGRSLAVPLLDPRGAATGWFGAASDVTKRRQVEQHLRLAVQELNHRVKNTLAMIQAMAAHFPRPGSGGPGPASLRRALGRPGSANDLLTGERGVGVSLEHVLWQAGCP